MITDARKFELENTIKFYAEEGKDFSTITWEENGFTYRLRLTHDCTAFRLDATRPVLERSGIEGGNGTRYSGHYRTRRLDHTAKANWEMANWMRHVARGQFLLWEQRQKEKKEKEAAEAAKRDRVQELHNAAPKMKAIIQSLVYHLDHQHGWDPLHPACQEALNDARIVLQELKD